MYVDLKTTDMSETSNAYSKLYFHYHRDTNIPDKQTVWNLINRNLFYLLFI